MLEKSYMQMIEEINDKFDNKPIGIILYKSKKEVAMEYALGGLE